MRKLILAGAVMLAAGVAQAAQMNVAQCTFPEQKPEVPDGATATQEQMAQAQADVQTFVQEGQASLQCLADVEKSLGEEITEEQQEELVALHNERFDQLNAVAADFNEQLQEYNNR